MLRSFACYLSGRHDYGMSREPGALYLRCAKCGHRSPGWAVDEPLAGARKRPSEATPVRTRAEVAPVAAFVSDEPSARVLPFVRTATE